MARTQSITNKNKHQNQTDITTAAAGKQPSILMIIRGRK